MATSPTRSAATNSGSAIPLFKSRAPPLPPRARRAVGGVTGDGERHAPPRRDDAISAAACRASKRDLPFGTRGIKPRVETGVDPTPDREECKATGHCQVYPRRD